jgi:DNA invertase Pin-like site-specific DNA recombinase
MKIGYARVSTKDQNLDLQNDALLKAGCEKIYSEKESSMKQRPELEKLMENIRNGDVIVIWKLDRLGRSLKDLISLVEKFNEAKVGLVSIKDNIDTSTPQGRLFLNIIASLAEFERDIIVERTKAGLAAARRKGRLGGRPKGLSEEKMIKAKNAKKLYEQGVPVPEIVASIGISRASLYRYLNILENSKTNRL